jgi:hypothetical protein
MLALAVPKCDSNAFVARYDAIQPLIDSDPVEAYRRTFLLWYDIASACDVWRRSWRVTLVYGEVSLQRSALIDELQPDARVSGLMYRDAVMALHQVALDKDAPAEARAFAKAEYKRIGGPALLGRI